MIIEKKNSLKPILESSEGIHLTVYLANRGNLIDLKRQLRKALKEASEWLHSVQNFEERKKFLDPVDALLHDTKILKSMKSNIGIFRTSNSFRILNVPVELETQCHVANSFHVKPLLRWMQIDREFLLLGLKADSAELYFGSQSSLQKIDAILFPEFFKENDGMGDYLSLKKSMKLRLKRDETYIWLSEWLSQMTQKSTPKLFLAGEKSLVAGILKNLKYKNISKAPISQSFGDHNLSEVSQTIRKILKDEATKTLSKLS